MITDQEKLRPIRRMLTGVLAFQLVLAGILFLGDIGRDFSLPSSGPRAPAFDQPIRPGDQTRRYGPDLQTRPGTGIETGPMPERLVLQPLDDGRALLTGNIEPGDGRALLTGNIEPGDGERIARQIASTEAAEIVLHSPGGSVSDALEVGRAVRTAGKTTRLRERDVCLSACPYILSAGTERRVDEGGRVGVHQHYFGENTLLPAFVAVQGIQRGQGEVMRYLDEMGVDPMLLVHGLSTPPQSIYVLSREELETYEVVTD